MEKLPEVRYHYLRPAEAVARREACPIAYIPIGTIEWHGPHDPLGLDGLQAEHLAIRAAEIGGGLAFPVLWYGDNRLECLMDSNPLFRPGIAEAMRYPEELQTPEHFLYDETQQTAAYHHLLLHILNQAESLGFKLAVLVCGHYPLLDHAAMAVMEYNKKRRKVEMLTWAVIDYLPLRDRYEFAGDHAGGWETSHMLASHPDLVDLSLLPAEGAPVGTGGKLPAREANAELGQRAYEEAAAFIVREAHHRLAHPDIYKGHGFSLMTGLGDDGRPLK